MAQLETVRGPIDSADLGTTLMHEHVFVLTTEVQTNVPGIWDEDERVADAVAKLQLMAGLGIKRVLYPQAR